MSSYIIAGSADNIDTAYVIQPYYFVVLRDCPQDKVKIQKY